MAVQRFSAIRNFGVTVDSFEQISDKRSILHLLEAYGIEGEAIPEDLTDITPYYLAASPFKYFISRRNRLAPVEVDIIPVAAMLPVIATVALAGNGESILARTDIRHVVIPNQSELFVIGGPDQRYAGKICLHEAILDI